jgi:AmiR/NasT family two-component response regulator
VPTRVVIAEDEAIIRLDLKETLEEEGYEVVGETGRGDEAIDLVRQLEPDVCILDIKMPGLDGLSATREITGHELSAVLILTAFSQRDLIDQAVDAGALAEQARTAEEGLETRKIVDRAKGRLMDNHQLSENDAFGFIQKTAMRERKTMKAIAEQVIAGELTP